MGSSPAAIAAQHSLTRLGAIGAAGVLAFASAWIVLFPPEAAEGPWVRWSVVTAVLALVSALVGVFPGWRWSAWVPVSCTAVALLSLIAVKVHLGLDGSWAVIEWIALGGLLAAVAVPAVMALGIAAGAVVVAGWAAQSGAGALKLFATPLAAMSVSARLAAVAFVLLAGAALLRRYAQATDAMLKETRRTLAAMAAERRAHRSRELLRGELHDTWLNTLEAVSRCRDPQSAAALRNRCVSEDGTWLREWIWEPEAGGVSGVGGVSRPTVGADVFAAAVRVGRIAGVTVTTDVIVGGRPPDEVLRATVAAAAEAVRNIVKHAGVATAKICGRMDESLVDVVVRDAGDGFPVADRSNGIGLRTSIAGRMVAVGGSVDVTSDLGVGTSVHLRWCTASDCSADAVDGANRDPFEAVAGIDLVGTLARASRWAIVAVVVFGCLASVLAIGSMRVPAWVAISALVMGGVSWWFVRQFRAGSVTWVDIALTIVVLCGVTVTQPYADPYCTSVAGSALIPDGRLMVLMLPVALLASARVLSIGLVCSTLSVVVAGALWQVSWPPCAPQAALAGSTLMILGVVALLFGGAMHTQQSRATRLLAESWARDRARAQREADERVRIQWQVPITMDVLALLTDIGRGEASPLDPSVRRQAALRSARLRAAIQVSELPQPLAHACTQIVTFTREHGVSIVVHGDPSEWELAADRTTSAARDLAMWMAAAPEDCESVTLSFAQLSDVYSMVVQLQRRGEASSEREWADPNGELWHWSDEAGTWWQAEWVSAIDVPEMAPPAQVNHP